MAHVERARGVEPGAISVERGVREMRRDNGIGRRSMVAVVAAALLVGASAPEAAAAPGDRDPSFSGNGKRTTNFTPGPDYAWDVAIQPNGKIVVAGGAGGSGGRFALARYRKNGTLDGTFGTNGRVRTNFTSGSDAAAGVAIQANGKIVAAGRAGRRFALARYRKNGTLDRTFGTSGRQMTNFQPGHDWAMDVAIQDDGRILAAGAAEAQSGLERRFALARYRKNGTLDGTFGTNGRVRTNFTAARFDRATGVAIQQDDKIVAVGEAAGRFALARYNTDGTLDGTFGGNGRVRTNFTSGLDMANGVAIQADGKIVAAGRAAGRGGRFALARYLADEGDEEAAFFEGFWTATTLGQARDVQEAFDQGHQPWRGDPASVAEVFAREIAGWEIQVVNISTAGSPEEGWSASVIFRPYIGEPRHLVPGAAHTLDLVGLEGAEVPAWLVAGLRSEKIVVEEPTPGDAVSSPLRVTGRGQAYEGTILAEIRDDAGNLLLRPRFPEGVLMAGAMEPEAFEKELSFDNPGASSGILILKGDTGGGPVPNITIVRLWFGDGER